MITNQLSFDPMIPFVPCNVDQSGDLCNSPVTEIQVPLNFRTSKAKFRLIQTIPDSFRFQHHMKPDSPHNYYQLWLLIKYMQN